METLQIIGNYLIWVFIGTFIIGVVVASAEQIVILWKSRKQ